MVPEHVSPVESLPETERSNRNSLVNIVASLLLVVRPGAPSSFLLLVEMPGAPSSVLAPRVAGQSGARPDQMIEPNHQSSRSRCGTAHTTEF